MLLDGLCSKRTAIIRGVELIFMLAGFISTVLMLKWAFENFCSYDFFLLLTLRKAWFYIYFRSWLSSPFYICVIMNSIVIFITASSLLHYHEKRDNNPENVVVVGVDDYGSEEDFFFQSSVLTSPNPNHMPSSHQNSLPPALATNISSENHIFLSEVTVFTNSDFLETVFLESKFKTESLENPKNREKNNVEEVVVEEEEDDDRNVTMEETWQAINGGENPQKKQLKKSETWPESPPEVGSFQYGEEKIYDRKSAKKKDLKKSMTFNETVSVRCRGGLMRDPSMSIEEFNGRVEAFINKFNNEMRLQRQESEQRFLEMINRSI